MKHILLPLWSNNASTRNFLVGFSKYARTRKDWTVDIIREVDLNHPAIMKRISDGAYDGIVTNERTLLSHHELAGMENVTLVINATYAPGRKAGNNIVFVQHNNQVTGRFAASYLTKLGAFAAYAYVPTFPSEPWSEERGRGFAAFLGKHGRKCFVHDPDTVILGASGL